MTYNTIKLPRRDAPKYAVPAINSPLSTHGCVWEFIKYPKSQRTVEHELSYSEDRNRSTHQALLLLTNALFMNKYCFVIGKFAELGSAAKTRLAALQSRSIGTQRVRNGAAN
ncbi:hypothetical protein ACTXOQ_11345 [Glutamicibacter arilaitensis]